MAMSVWTLVALEFGSWYLWCQRWFFRRLKHSPERLIAICRPETLPLESAGLDRMLGWMMARCSTDSAYATMLTDFRIDSGFAFMLVQSDRGS